MQKLKQGGDKEAVRKGNQGAGGTAGVTGAWKGENTRRLRDGRDVQSVPDPSRKHKLRCPESSLPPCQVLGREFMWTGMCFGLGRGFELGLNPVV